MFSCYFSVAVKRQRSKKYKVQKTIPGMHTLKPNIDRESTHWRTFNAPLDNQGESWPLGAKLCRKPSLAHALLKKEKKGAYLSPSKSKWNPNFGGLLKISVCLIRQLGKGSCSHVRFNSELAQHKSYTKHRNIIYVVSWQGQHSWAIVYGPHFCFYEASRLLWNFGYHTHKNFSNAQPEAKRGLLIYPHIRWHCI